MEGEIVHRGKPKRREEQKERKKDRTERKKIGNIERSKTLWCRRRRGKEKEEVISDRLTPLQLLERTFNHRASR